jgi:hypothetical protein
MRLAQVISKQIQHGLLVIDHQDAMCGVRHVLQYTKGLWQNGVKYRTRIYLEYATITSEIYNGHNFFIRRKV